MAQIKEYPDYEIDMEGNVYSYKYGKRKKLKPQLVTQAKKKYLQVGLFGENNRRNKKGQKVPRMLYVHRLVWETFVGEIPEGMTIDHRNENKFDCSLENLEQMTQGDNTSKYFNNTANGLLMNKRDEFIKDHKELGTYQQVADKWGVSMSSVFRIIKNYKRTKRGIEKLHNIQDEYTTQDMRGTKARKDIGLIPPGQMKGKKK